MASTSVPSTIRFCTNSSSFLPAPYIAHESGLTMKLRRHENFSLNISQPIHFSNLFTKTTHAAAVACCAANDPGPQEDYKPLETVLNLYEAIKNKNVNQLSDIIAEECSCISNFVSAFQPYLGKKQVMDFFSYLMKYLGNNIEIVVQKTSDEGMVVGVSWKLGNFSSFITLLDYNSSSSPSPVIRVEEGPAASGKRFQLLYVPCLPREGDDKASHWNVEMFLEPVLHMEPLRLVRILNQARLGTDNSGDGCHRQAYSPVGVEEQGKKGHYPIVHPSLPGCTCMFIQIMDHVTKAF
ncbi:hypothetical protein SASPL_123888 [Salvia splendens]|uniref:Uncharacterized protein n=1 Tax=Salvia splendens TaxID=180675 RepID=A0A8X8ZTM1_SALSN|nr:hypothetical protein SASPL_123888 [Salvia splendens]